MQRWAIVAAVLMPAAVLPQEPGVSFSTAVTLVEVYASVTDVSGAPVTGLRREDFQVFEDGVLQEVSVFAAGEFPLTVALGVDRSVSMAGEPLRLAKQASRAFLAALGPADRSMVVAIGSEAEVVSPLGTDRPAQLRAVDRLDAWSTTALFDALVVSLDRLAAEPGRQALVFFSDGVDRYSRTSSAEALERARRSRALVYPVVIGRTRPAVTAELAGVSGGRSFQLRDARQLEPTLQSIARELRHQYLLGYAPGSGAAGWRSIRVALTSPRSGVRIRARDGYSGG